MSKLNEGYKKIKEKDVKPNQMFAVIVYGYMNGLYSSRKIEKACKRDINFMYLLEGKKAPDHATIARFRSQRLKPIISELLSQLDEKLALIGEISLENIFIDGTKIESCANRYSFVWKKAILKNQQKLWDKAALLISKIKIEYEVEVRENTKLRHLKSIYRKLSELREKSKIKFLHGKGQRKTYLQKSMEALKEYINRFKKYNHQLYLCGKRNSYSKTDIDATFMRMKEDYMKNGQLKPAYNIQIGVDSEYIIWVSQGSNPTDTNLLIPFLEDFSTHFKGKYKNIVADAGYESEENYCYLDRNCYNAYIKPNNYEKSKTRKFKKDISQRENMKYDRDSDSYICQNGRKIIKTGIKYRKNDNGYLSEKTTYSCEDCSNCTLKKDCIKSQSKKPLELRTKRFEVSKKFLEQRNKSFEKITSEFGKLLRMNRSIQVEGAFGNLKQDFGFRRFLCRGKDKILIEMKLLAFAHNINKLHKKIQTGKTGTHLFNLRKSK